MDNKIIKVYVEEFKYGLIDILGQLCVNVIYDELGQFLEGCLVVKWNDLWGFVNVDGVEVILC